MTGDRSRQISLPRVAVLGAGHVGPVIARLMVAAGYPVSIAASGDPERIALIVEVVAPGVRPRWSTQAIEESDIVVLAIPSHRFAALNPKMFAGRLVVDAMNYWPWTDGVQELFEDPRYGSSEIVQQRLRGATVVKALNEIGYQDLEDARRPAGSPERRAVGVAGDDPSAVDQVARLIDRVGYDAVRLNSLQSGRQLQPGGPVFGALVSGPEFEQAVRTAA